MEHVEIQVQDSTGNWRTYSVQMQNNSLMIQMAMKALKDQFPDQRVRAVDQDGRLIDVMM